MLDAVKSRSCYKVAKDLILIPERKKMALYNNCHSILRFETEKIRKPDPLWPILSQQLFTRGNSLYLVGGADIMDEKFMFAFVEIVRK